MEGSFRFLRRVWRRVYETRDLLLASKGLKPDMAKMETPERDLYRKLHESIAKITHDLEGAFQFNTAIAQIMELMNTIDVLKVDAGSSEQCKAVYRETIESLVVLLSPFAPHVAEELWGELGHPPSILTAPWPQVNEKALALQRLQGVILSIQFDALCQVGGHLELILVDQSSAADPESAPERMEVNQNAIA